MRWTLSGFLFFYVSVAVASPWGDYVIKNVVNKRPGGINAIFDRSDALQLPWRFDEEEFGITGREAPPRSFVRKPLVCEKSKRLWPTHPQQETKNYHFAVYAPYNHGKKLDPNNSSICAQPNSKTKPTRCMRGTTARVVVMSDTYQDECGNMYRGFWVNFYTVGSKYYGSGTESMGTLASKGRWFSIDENGDNFKLSSTYSLSKSDFLFLAEPFPTDEIEVRKAQQRAARLVKKKGFMYLDQK